MSSSNSKEVSVQSVVKHQTERVSISTMNTAGMFEVSYVHTATHVWSDGSNLQRKRKDSLTISGIPRLQELWDELLSLLVDLGNGDNLGNAPDDDSWAYK